MAEVDGDRRNDLDAGEIPQRSAEGRDARPAPSGKVDHVDREAAADENGLKALASVRRTLPGFPGLASAMDHHDRHPSRSGRNLVLDVEVLDAVGLPLAA